MKNQPEAIRPLVEAGADVDAGFQDHFTPLLLAVRRFRPDVIRALLKCGADPTVKTEDGKTARELAAEQRRDTSLFDEFEE